MKIPKPKEMEVSVRREGSVASASEPSAPGSRKAAGRCEFRDHDGRRCPDLAEYEVPVWDRQPVPGHAPVEATQSGNWWCLTHAVCAIASVQQGPRGKANFSEWCAKYTRARELLQRRVREVIDSREARCERDQLQKMLENGQRQLLEVGARCEAHLAERQQQAEELRVLAEVKHEQFGRLEVGAYNAVAQVQAHSAGRVGAVEEDCRRQLQEYVGRAQAHLEEKEVEIVEAARQRFNFAAQREEECARSALASRAQAERAEAVAMEVGAEARRRVAELTEASKAAAVRATAADAKAARIQQESSSDLAKLTGMLREQDYNTKSHREAVARLDGQVRTLRMQRGEETERALRAKSELSEGLQQAAEERQACAEKTGDFEALAKLLVEQRAERSELRDAVRQEREEAQRARSASVQERRRFGHALEEVHEETTKNGGGKELAASSAEVSDPPEGAKSQG